MRFTNSSAPPSSIFCAYSPPQRKGTRPGHRQTFRRGMRLVEPGQRYRIHCAKRHQTAPRSTPCAPVIRDLPFALPWAEPRSSRTPAAVPGLCTGKSPNFIKEFSQGSLARKLLCGLPWRPGAEGQRSAPLILPRRGIERRRWD